jgi:hypothetical protein
VYRATDPSPLTLRLASGDLQVVSTTNASIVLAPKPVSEIAGVDRIDGAGYDADLTIEASLPQFAGASFSTACPARTP